MIGSAILKANTSIKEQIVYPSKTTNQDIKFGFSGGRKSKRNLCNLETSKNEQINGLDGKRSNSRLTHYDSLQAQRM